MAIKILSETVIGNVTLSNWILSIKAVFRVERQGLSVQNYRITYRLHYYETQDDYELGVAFKQELGQLSVDFVTNPYTQIYDSLKLLYPNNVDC
jgi:hypothetical protein